MSQSTSDTPSSASGHAGPDREIAPEMRANWPVVLATIGCGFAAALHVGKAPAALASIGIEFGASLTILGWIASVMALVGALTGISLGLAAQRIDSRRLLAAALVCLGIGSLTGAYAPGPELLMMARVVEGTGLIAIAVAAPRLIVANAGSERGFALGLWSTYVPMGMALGVSLSIGVLGPFGWDGLWLACAIITALWLGIFLVATRNARTPSPITPGNWRRPLRRRRPWLLGLAFACYALNWMALMTWLPDFASMEAGYTRTGAQWLTVAVIAVNIAGNVSGAFLVRRAVSPVRLVCIGLAAMAITGPALVALDSSLAIRFALALAFSAVSGLLPPAIFGSTVRQINDPSEVAPINGIIVQSSQTGQLAGAPLFGWLVAYGGSFSAVAWVFVATSALGITAAITSAWLDRRAARS